MLTIKNLADMFPEVSRKCMRYEEEEGAFIQGQRCRITLFGDAFDIFIGPGLHGRTIARFADLMKSYKGKLTRLDGEAHFKTEDRRAVINHLSFFGIRKKRVVSEETRARLLSYSHLNR